MSALWGISILIDSIDDCRRSSALALLRRQRPTSSLSRLLLARSPLNACSRPVGRSRYLRWTLATLAHNSGSGVSTTPTPSVACATHSRTDTDKPTLHFSISKKSDLNSFAQILLLKHFVNVPGPTSQAIV